LKLKYSEKFINSAISWSREINSKFVMFKQMQPFGSLCHSRIEDQPTLYEGSSDLRKKIDSDLRPVFTSKKIADDIKVAEVKPPLINQHCVVYKIKCDLCDADYVGYTHRHLFERTDEHKHSAFGKHLRDAHNQRNKDLHEQFTILKNCRGKFECLIYEMLFVQEKKP